MNTNLNEYTIADLRVLIAAWKAKDGVGVTPEEAVAVAHILDIILDAGTGVVDSWEEGDLAGSVHELQVAMGYDLFADEDICAMPECGNVAQPDSCYCADCDADTKAARKELGWKD